MSQSLFGRGSGGGLAGGLSGGLQAAAVALLVQQLISHARRGSAEPAPAAPAGGKGAAPSGSGYSGPFGDILGGLFGGSHAAEAPAQAPAAPTGKPGALDAGATPGTVVGGLGGWLDRLRGHGGDMQKKVDSWVSTGPNQPVSPQELERAFDPAALDDIARRAGVDRATLLQAMSEVLPQAVDRMTPQGKVPQRESDLGSGGLGGVFGGFLGGKR